jgi:flagellar motor switch protein FliN/FliY
MHNENSAQPEMVEQTAKIVSLSELSKTSKAGPKMFDGNFSVIAGVKVNVEVVVGTAEMTVQELFALQKGSVVALSQLHDAPLDIRLDGKSIATGSLVVVGENFGICITEILDASAVKPE